MYCFLLSDKYFLYNSEQYVIHTDVFKSQKKRIRKMREKRESMIDLHSPVASVAPDPAWWSPRAQVSRACQGTNPPAGYNCPGASTGVARSRNYRHRNGKTIWKI